LPDNEFKYVSKVSNYIAHCIKENLHAVVTLVETKQ